MRHASLVLTFLFGAAACLATASAGAQSDGGTAPTTEQRVLDELGPIASREGPMLTLALDGGRSARFETKDDCASGPQSCVIYRLLGLSPDRRFFVVEMLGYESATRYWIARSNGKQVEVYAETNISPDGSYIVTANPLECCGGTGVFAWQIDRGQLIEKFRLKRAEYPLYRFDRWINPTTAQLIKITHADKALCPTAAMMESAARLTRKSSSWVLDEPLVPTRVMCK